MSSFRRLALTVLLAWGLWAPQAALAQMFGQQTLVIENARIVTMDGRVIESGSIIIRGDRIAAVGAALEVPANAKVVDAGGATITPGLIDADASLASSAASGTGDATHRAYDRFNRFDTDAIRAAWSAGITSIYVPAGGGSGINGVGAVVRLRQGAGESVGEALNERAALSLNFGSGDDAVRRLSTFNNLRKAFRGALEYRESLETYEEDLEEYEKKIRERAEKEAEGDDEGKEGNGKPDDEAGNGEGNGDPGVFQQRRQRRGGQRPRNGQPPANGQDKKKEGGDDEIKKPTRPKKSRRNDVLLEALDGEIAVRCRAHRSADILNAIALADEFDLDLAIEGGAEAHLVADELADAEIPVLLGAMLPVGIGSNRALRRHDLAGIACLEKAGVDWLPTSGAGGSRMTNHLLLNAQLTRRAVPDQDPLELVTARAADMLGIDDETGRVRPGLAADLVLWSGDPLDPAARVQSVYVAGRRVYEEASR